MASSASTLLRMEKMATTENSGTWGTKTNTNLDILELAIRGRLDISTTGGTTTLANVDYTADDAKNHLIAVTGTLVSDATIVIPNAKGSRRIFNQTTGSFAVKIKTSSGSSITLTQSTVADVWCDGNNICYFATPMTNFSTGAPATASGAAASSVSVTPSGNISSTDAQAALVELQGDINTINALLISGYQPLAARLTDLSSVAVTKGNMYIGNGSNIVALGIGTNGYVHVADSSSSTGTKWSALMPAATVALFYQAAAPTGWTVSNAHNDYAIRCVSGTSGVGGTSGGSSSFSTMFTARTIAQANLPNVTLTAASNGAHVHDYTWGGGHRSAGGAGQNVATTDNGSSGQSSTGALLTISSDGAHTHSVPLGGSGTAMDFAVAYISVIKASKDAY